LGVYFADMGAKTPGRIDPLRHNFLKQFFGKSHPLVITDDRRTYHCSTNATVSTE